MINLNAMLATKDEYLDNIEKIKGTSVAGFMKDAATVLILTDQAVSAKTQTEVTSLFVVLAARTLQLIVHRHGIPEGDSIPLLQDCDTMIKAVERAAMSPVEVI